MKLVWRKTAEFHLKGDEPSVAAKSLEELLKSNPKDKTTLAQLVLAYAKFDLGKAMEMSKRLPDFASKAIDVDSLETSATLSRYGKKTVGGMSSPKPQTPEQQKEAALLKVYNYSIFVCFRSWDRSKYLVFTISDYASPSYATWGREKRILVIFFGYFDPWTIFD